MNLKIWLVMASVSFVGCTQAKEYAENKQAEYAKKADESAQKTKHAEKKLELLLAYSNCLDAAKTEAASKKCEELKPPAEAGEAKTKEQVDQEQWDEFTGKKNEK